MKKFLVIALFLAGLVVGTAAGADPGGSQTAKDVHKLKKDYTASVHKDLKKIGSKIDRFKRDAGKTGKTAKADLDKEVKRLEIQKADADRKLSELERSTGDAWKDLRQGVDGAVADLRHSVDEAVRQFKK